MVRVQVAGGRLVLKADLLAALHRGAAPARLLAGGALDRPAVVFLENLKKKTNSLRISPHF